MDEENIWGDASEAHDEIQDTISILSGFCQENVGCAVIIWHFFFLRGQKILKCVLDLIMSLRCIPQMFSSSMPQCPTQKREFFGTH